VKNHFFKPLHLLLKIFISINNNRTMQLSETVKNSNTKPFSIKEKPRENIKTLFLKSAKEVILKNSLLKNLYYKLLKVKDLFIPYKSPRVYIRKGIGRMEFFEILHQRKIDYVLLRWWEDLPEIPEGEDMDILIKDEHRDLIQDLLTYRDN